MLKVPSRGSNNGDAKIMLLLEYPGFSEEMNGVPITGVNEFELKQQLKEVGININDCYITNVCKFRPDNNDIGEWVSDKKTTIKTKGYTLLNDKYVHKLILDGLNELHEEIAAVKPQVIIGFGNLALWACTGNWGIGNWRGSELVYQNSVYKASEASLPTRTVPFVPTYHPSSILRAWHNRPQVIHDLQMRVARRLKNGFETPTYRFNTAPSIEEALEWLNETSGVDVAADIETANGTTICVGFAKSAHEAICIPFKGPDGAYWAPEQYAEILLAIRRMSQRVSWIGQNWNYDAQYFDEDFGWTRMADFDTYVAQSVLLPGSERGLGYLSSMYCDHHVFWKEDAKDWGKLADFNSLFRYNCLDVCRDWEIAQQQRIALEKANLMPQFLERMKYSHTVYRMMRRGITRDQQRTQKMIAAVDEEIQAKTLTVSGLAGKPVNFSSPKQVGELLFKQMGLKPVGKLTSKGAASTNDDSLKKLMEKYPAAAEVCMPILECRSLRSVKSNFLEAELDPDGKFRSSFMATGTETFRLTSSGNAFHRGGPLQNVTDGKHTHSGRALPNLRSTIVPDAGCTIFNCDLERADLQVVAWEADDSELMQMLIDHVDIHTENAKNLWGVTTPTEQQRHFGKTFVHLTNYGGGHRTCAVKCHTTVHQAELLQRRWFEIHPGIKRWHQRTQAALLGTRTIYNRFGYRRIYLDRIDGVLPEGLAWVPQSSVAILISLMQMAIETKLGDEAPILLQVHDSIVGQYRTCDEDRILRAIKAASHISVPYARPLFIPLDLATSTSSWGEVVKRDWPI